MLFDESKIPKEHHIHRPGGWLPSDHRIHKDWLEGIIEHVEKNPTELDPVLQEFKDLIEGNTRIYMLCNQMFEEVPNKKPYSKDPTGHRQIRDYHHMLELLNHVIKTAPHWNDKSHGVGMVGTPVEAVLDWPMGTPSGYAFFIDPDVNRVLKKVLNRWAEFLSSPESGDVLEDNDYSWFSDHGKSSLADVANLSGETKKSFEELFECDPKAPRHGYKSWDDFFTRRFKEESRPVAEPEDDDVIANACESEPYNVATNVKARDRFWAKGQFYSVYDMLSHDELAEQFVGGTVYQAFLSALSYHRWHAPVSGVVKKEYVVQGTYFSEPLFEGLGDPEAHRIDPSGESTGQGYLTAVATRSIIFIEADNPTIGLMAFLGIGMTEVSTCENTVKEGQRVKKGDQIGMFHYGGSTHCLMFRKGVKLEGFPQPGRKTNVPVRSRLAVVKH